MEQNRFPVKKAIALAAISALAFGASAANAKQTACKDPQGMIRGIVDDSYSTNGSWLNKHITVTTTPSRIDSNHNINWTVHFWNGAIRTAYYRYGPYTHSDVGRSWSRNGPKLSLKFTVTCEADR